MLLNHKNGMYQIYDYNELSGPGYDRVDTSSVAKAAEMTYCSVQEGYGNGRNYIASLRPGESVQVIMAWIVNEGDLDNMYLNLTGDGAAFDFTDEILEHGVVNICQ